MTAPLRPDDPRVLGRYELTGRLGEGGMGAVFLGHHPLTGPVAIKVIRAEFAGDPGFRARFRSEVARAREVPAFCTAEVLDADPDHETPYLVVEYVDGPSLADVVRDRGPLRGGSLHSIAVGVATALVGIHSAGIVHRDLKPGNVLLAPGSPKVIDFGIAKAVEATSHHTRTQETIGTPAFMAPERFGPAGTAATPAADVFAWGCVVAYAATGRSPFSADGAAAVVGRILTQPPRLDGLPPELAGLVGRALAKDPSQRPTARELLLELTGGPGASVAVGPGSAPPAAPDDSRRLAGSRRSFGRWRAAGAGAAALALLAAGGTWAGGRLGERAAALPQPSPSPSASEAPPARQSAKELFDPLTSPSLWSPSGPADEGCSFGTGLTVRTEFMIRCEHGPTQVFAGDLRIRVRAQLSVRACAIIYFRLTELPGDDDGSNGYFATVCDEEVSVNFLNGFLEHMDTRSVRDGTMKRLGIEENGWHSLGVDVTGKTAKVSVDGKTVHTTDLSRGEAAGARHTSGKVTFGASGGNGPAITVVYRDAQVTKQP